MALLISLILVFLFTGFIFRLVFGAVGLAFKLVFWSLQLTFGIIGWIFGGGLITFLVIVGILYLIGLPILAIIGKK